MLKTTRANRRQAHGRGVHRAAPRDRRGRTASRSRATSRKRRSSASRPSSGVFGNRFQTTGLTLGRGARDCRCCCAAARWRRPSPSPTNASSVRSSARRTSRRASSALVVGMARAVRVHDHLLPRGRGHRRHRPLLANLFLTVRVHGLCQRAFPAGPRRHRPDHRHGRGRQRADLRTHPRGTRNATSWRWPSAQNGLRPGLPDHSGHPPDEVSSPPLCCTWSATINPQEASASVCSLSA